MGRWSLFLAIVLATFTQLSLAQETRLTGETTQLSPGQQAGTFAFSYSGKIRFAQEEAFPVHVILSTEGQTPVADLVVKNRAPFTISADLVPGGYQIQSEIMPVKEGDYWNAMGPRFFINSNGGIRFVPTDDSFVHKKKLQLLVPNPQHLTSTNRSNMLVRWTPLRAADHYHVSWSEQELPQRNRIDVGGEDTKEAEFQFQEEVHANRRYEFSIHAYDSGGKILASTGPVYFYTVGAKKGTEPKTVSTSSSSREKRESRESAREPEPRRVKVAVPFFGVRPEPVQGGVRVAGIGSNTPARKAGLQLDDILTNFNGTALSEVKSVDEFARLVQSLSPGSKVMVEFYRKGERMAAEVTIEAKRQ